MYSQRELYENMCDRDAKLHELEEVSGHSIDTLISLFAAGFELVPKWSVGLLCRKCGGSGFVQSGPGILGIKRCPDCDPKNW